MSEGNTRTPQNPSNHGGDQPNNDEGAVIYTNGAVGEISGETGDNSRDTHSSEPAAMDVEGENIAHGLQLPDVPPGASQLDTTINFLQQHINSEFSKLDAGTINTLSEQTMSLLYKLLSLTSSKNAMCPPASDSQSAAASPSFVHTFAEVKKINICKKVGL